MTDNIVRMSEKLGDGTFQTPEQALQDALDNIGKHGAFESGKKILILALDDDGKYNISFIQAGMKMSECVGLCEIAKTLFLTEMEYI